MWPLYVGHAVDLWTLALSGQYTRCVTFSNSTRKCTAKQSVCTAWQTNDKKSRHTYKTHSEQRVTAILNRGNILFEIRKGGDSHIIFIHVTCPSLKKLRKLKNQFWVFFFSEGQIHFYYLELPNMVLHRLKSSELHCIKLSRVNLYNAWKQFLGRGYLKLSVVLFHTMTFHFFFFRMSWCSINQFTLLSIYLAYFSQLIKGFVLFPLHPVLYVKVGSSSCYLTCVKYLRNDVIIARTKQDRTKKKWIATVYHLDISL